MPISRQGQASSFIAVRRTRFNGLPRGKGVGPYYFREGLKRYTPQTYTRPEDLKGHLREIREKGYAFNDGEIYRDVRGVAAPVRNRLGEVVAGLGIAGPSYRVTKQKLKIFLKHVVQTSRKISAHLGHEIKKPAMNHGEGGDHADRES